MSAPVASLTTLGVERKRERARELGLSDFEAGTASERAIDDYLASADEDLQANRWPNPIDLARLLAQPPTPPRMIIDDWLPAGYATLFAGHGGAGKSSIGMHLAACLATGRPWWGLHCARRRVLYLSCEDRAEVLHWRLAHIGDYEELAGDDLTDLHLVDLVGHDSILYRRDPLSGVTLTASYLELERVMRETGAEVLIIDGASDTFGGNSNARSEVKEFVSALVRLIGVSGAVIIISHVNKATAAASSTTEGYSGSTQWHNVVRARWYLYPETEAGDEGKTATGRLILALQKSNLGRDDQALTFNWDEQARLFVAESATKRIDREQRDETERAGIIAAIREVAERGDYVPAAIRGPRTAWHVLAATNTLPESLKSAAAKRRFSRHLEILRRDCVLREGSIRRGNRHYTATLELVSYEV